VQQNLLYVYAAPDSRIANYEANPDACYNIIRSGKIVDMVREEFGPAEEEVVRTLMQLGHARISDLVQAFGFQSTNGESTSNGHSVNGHSASEYPRGAGNVRSLRDLHTVLGRLVIAEIVDQVGPKTFRNPDDIYREIEDEINKGLPGEKSTAKAKEKMRETVDSQFQAARDESKKLKRQLNQTMPLSVKRRKLAPGAHAQASNGLGDVSEIDVSSSFLGRSCKTWH
jgi:DNA-directed RNA polymerase III subunit RPC3